MKAVLRGKSLALKACIKKVEKCYTEDLAALLKVLEQREIDSPGRIRQQKIIKFSTKINKNRNQ